jgi:hypothetical protein
MKSSQNKTLSSPDASPPDKHRHATTAAIKESQAKIKQIKTKFSPHPIPPPPQQSTHKKSQKSSKTKSSQNKSLTWNTHHPRQSNNQNKATYQQYNLKDEANQRQAKMKFRPFTRDYRTKDNKIKLRHSNEITKIKQNPAKSTQGSVRPTNHHPSNNYDAKIQSKLIDTKATKHQKIKSTRNKIPTSPAAKIKASQAITKTTMKIMFSGENSIVDTDIDSLSACHTHHKIYLTPQQ